MMMTASMVLFWCAFCAFVYAMIEGHRMIGHRHDHQVFCARCPHGSTTTTDAMPLWNSQAGRDLVQLTGVHKNENWCPHCTHLALWAAREAVKGK